MHNEFTAIIERDGDWYVAYCPEISGANGQGTTKEAARKSLADAIALILEDRRAGVGFPWHPLRLSRAVRLLCGRRQMYPAARRKSP